MLGIHWFTEAAINRMTKSFRAFASGGIGKLLVNSFGKNTRLSYSIDEKKMSFRNG